MNRRYKGLSASLAVFCLLAAARGAPVFSQQKSELVAVSADVVEISGSLRTQKGFSWNPIFEFNEAAIPGIIRVGEFERKTGLVTSLKLLETEGKAQLLSNPKVIAKSGTQANITVGGEIPVPYANNQGVGADFKKFGVILEVVPVVLQDKKDTIDVQLRLEVSNPDFSNTVTGAGFAIPSMVTRYVQTEVELKSGETLVIGGLKSSRRSVAKTRVPVLGRLPLIGALFRYSEVIDDQSSLFLFVTFEIVK